METKKKSVFEKRLENPNPTRERGKITSTRTADGVAWNGSTTLDDTLVQCESGIAVTLDLPPFFIFPHLFCFR